MRAHFIITLCCPRIHCTSAAPLDWGLDCFYETRKDAVEKCLLRILNEPLEDLITEAYKHEGERCVGCNWQYLSKEELIEIASCIGRTHPPLMQRARCTPPNRIRMQRSH